MTQSDRAEPCVAPETCIEQGRTTVDFLVSSPPGNLCVSILSVCKGHVSSLTRVNMCHVGGMSCSMASSSCCMVGSVVFQRSVCCVVAHDALRNVDGRFLTAYRSLHVSNVSITQQFKIFSRP